MEDHFNEKLSNPCPLCGSNTLRTLSNLDRKGTFLRTDICLCCGHVFSNPPPTTRELDLFYNKNYRKAYKGTSHPRKKHIIRSGQRAIERYNQIKIFLRNNSKVLEIGSGSGEFLFLLKEKGHIVKGIEPNRGFAEFSKTNYNIDVLINKFENFSTNDTKWDFIFLYHVLEHLLDPIESLKKISKLLHQNAFLNLEVPNVESKYHSPKRLFHFAHLHNFSLDGLIFTLSQANLEAVEIRKMPNTGHINAICKAKNLEAKKPTVIVANRINMHLLSYNSLTDILSLRPYRRFFDNLKRPFREYLKLILIGYSKTPSSLLKTLFKKNNL